MGNIIGIVCCPMTAKNILKQMSMPQDTFIVSSETTSTTPNDNSL